MALRLTEDQQKIVEDNHNLIYWYIHLCNLDHQEWYDLLAIELCYTVMKHDESKGSLSTYFKLRADGLVYKEYRKSQAQKRYHVDMEYIDNVGSDNGGGHEYVFNDKTDTYVKDLFKGEYGNIIRMRYEGYSQTEISTALGVSQSYVSKILKRVRAKYDIDR